MNVHVQDERTVKSVMSRSRKFAGRWTPRLETTCLCACRRRRHVGQAAAFVDSEGFSKLAREAIASAEREAAGHASTNNLKVPHGAFVYSPILKPTPVFLTRGASHYSRSVGQEHQPL